VGVDGTRVIRHPLSSAALRIKSNLLLVVTALGTQKHAASWPHMPPSKAHCTARSTFPHPLPRRRPRLPLHLQFPPHTHTPLTHLRQSSVIEADEEALAGSKLDGEHVADVHCPEIAHSLPRQRLLAHTCRMFRRTPQPTTDPA